MAGIGLEQDEIPHELEVCLVNETELTVHPIVLLHVPVCRFVETTQV